MPLFQLVRPYWDGTYEHPVRSIVDFPEGVRPPRGSIPIDSPTDEQAEAAAEAARLAEEAAAAQRAADEQAAAQKAADEAAAAKKK